MPQQAKTGNPNGTENSEDSKKENITLTFGVFFDGTQNSMGNIDERKAFNDYIQFREFIAGDRELPADAKARSEIVLKEGSSYLNEYSNVARFWKCFKRDTDEFIPIYVEGIGTKPRSIGKFKKKPIEKLKSVDEIIQQEVDFAIHFEDCSKNVFDKDEEELGEMGWSENDIHELMNIACSDSKMGSALGIGQFGVKAKVESMCEKIAKEIDAYFIKKKCGSRCRCISYNFRGKNDS